MASLASSTCTSTPARCSQKAAEIPAAPPPTTMAVRELTSARHQPVGVAGAQEHAYRCRPHAGVVGHLEVGVPSAPVVLDGAQLVDPHDVMVAVDPTVDCVA